MLARLKHTPAAQKRKFSQASPSSRESIKLASAAKKKIIYRALAADMIFCDISVYFARDTSVFREKRRCEALSGAGNGVDYYLHKVY